ncbi:zinc finger, CCHC-type containing protein [Tanacetum coccineum]
MPNHLRHFTTKSVNHPSAEPSYTDVRILFDKRGKLNPCYIGPFKISAKVANVTYRLELSNQLSRVHGTFYESNLKKCLSDETLAIPLDEIPIDDELHLTEEPVEIMDHEVKRKECACVYFKASNWLERLPAGSITTWEDLTTRFLAQFFPPGRTVKLRNDILMFQQHHGESLSEAYTRFKNLLQKVPYHGIDRWLQIQFFYDHVSFHLKCEIYRAADDKLCDKNANESWEIIENLALYDHEGWNNSKNFEEKSDKDDVATSDSIKKTNGSDAEILVKEVETENGTENRIKNESIKRDEKEEGVEAPSSQPVEYYLKHKINEKLIEGLVDNHRFNDSLLGVQVGKMKGKTLMVLKTDLVFLSLL